MKCKGTQHKMADVQNTFYYYEHVPNVDRWPKLTTNATSPFFFTNVTKE